MKIGNENTLLVIKNENVIASFRMIKNKNEKATKRPFLNDER